MVSQLASAFSRDTSNFEVVELRLSAISLWLGFDSYKC